MWARGQVQGLDKFIENRIKIGTVVDCYALNLPVRGMA